MNIRPDDIDIRGEDFQPDGPSYYSLILRHPTDAASLEGELTIRHYQSGNDTDQQRAKKETQDAREELLAWLRDFGAAR